MRQGQDFGHRISLYQRYPTGFTELQATRSPSVFRVSFRSYQRYSGNISTRAAPLPSSFSGGLPDTDGDAVLVFPIVEHSLYPHLRAEGLEVLLQPGQGQILRVFRPPRSPPG